MSPTTMWSPARLTAGRRSIPGVRWKPISNGQETGVKPPGTVGELVVAYIAAQCNVLASNDVGLRTATPVVHETRVAARRLCSTLRVFGDVVDAASAEGLNSELAWYADLLGEVRDREVLSARLTSLIDELPREQVRGSSRPRSPKPSLPNATTLRSG
jgi:hypothetical protein